jgi:hypothetical protein
VESDEEEEEAEEADVETPCTSNEALDDDASEAVEGSSPEAITIAETAPPAWPERRSALSRSRSTSMARR